MISQRPEDVFINLLRSVYSNAQHSALRLTRRRPTSFSQLSSTRHNLSTLSFAKTYVRPSIGYRTLCASSNFVSKAGKSTYATSNVNNTSTDDATRPREIAVLGAGITGLTAAHYLARHAKNANITIYEASDRPGGWIKADRIEVEDDEGRRGHVLFQHGPRMLRSGSTSTKYDDLVLYDVLASLNMADKIRHPKAVSDNRYMYYPDHLVKLPAQELSADNLVAMARSYLTEPIWSGGLQAAYNLWVSYNKTLDGSVERLESLWNEAPKDESVADFLKRILKDDRVVNNIVSGMMHGIYGGDINKLSAKHTMLDRLWYHFKSPTQPGSGRSWIGINEWYLLYDMMSGPNRLKVIELAENAVDWKLLAFEDGLVSLVDGLVKDLEKKSNVTFKYGEPVTTLEYQNGNILVTTPKVSHSSKRPAKYDHVICTLNAKKLARISKPEHSLPSLKETHAVTIMVVNLWYPNPNLLAEGGFGYLIPSSTPDNHECALGVLFDSDLRTGDDEMPGTKLTVMLGGHYWDDWEHLPTEEMGIAMAKGLVQRHLGISETEKVVARAHLCRDCLPQHFVGHRDLMKEAHYELMSAFQGHLTVAGPSYTTIGVIPAMRAGYDAGMRVARGHGQPWFRIPGQASPAPETAQNKPLPEADWWEIKPGMAMGFEADSEVSDMVGASGLERFTTNDWSQIGPFYRDRMPFRKFTKETFRFRDEDGHFLEPDQRPTKNAPPGLVSETVNEWPHNLRDERRGR
ncbi:Protoporphyrinogen oxidase [Xylariaceae sp. AK1471]|nr:Protoporphyrinogen oxidase [Xylariaceae sp. AK1471]